MQKIAAVPLSLVLLAAAGTTATAEPIETVVVTATRTAQPLERTGDSLSVITADDLKAWQTLAVSDALEQTPGLTVVRNGGPGQTATVGLRGATAGQTLFLIDGVRINDPSTVDGQAILGDLFVNDIERIEILRGPQSTLYGSDAIGGVIDILTRRGGTEPLALRASAEGGSFDTYRLNAAANGTVGSIDYGAAVNWLHTNGISAADKRNGNPEPDGTNNLGASVNTRYTLSPLLSFDLRGYYTRARTDFDDNFGPPPNFAVADSPVFTIDTLLAGYAGVNLTLLDGHWHNRFAYIGSHSDRDTFNSPFFLPRHEDFFFRGEAQHFEYQGIVDLDADNQITFGAETERTAIKSVIAGVPDTKGHKRISGYYAQGQTTLFSQLTLTGGVRYDNDDEFGGHTSLKFAGAWTPNDGVTVLRANYADGFKAPSLFELFSEFSNPLTALKPESARGWEAGIDQNFLGGRILTRLTYFERRTSNLIDFFSCFGPIPPAFASACTLRAAAGGFYFNVGRTRARGMELEAAAKLTDTLSLSANYTFMTAIDEVNHSDLARRPHITASAQIQWTPIQDWSVGASVLYAGRRFDGAGEFTPLGSHTTANLYASHALNEHLELFARIENLFDAQYEPVAGFGAPGRAVFGGIRATY